MGYRMTVQLSYIPRQCGNALLLYNTTVERNLVLPLHVMTEGDAQLFVDSQPDIRERSWGEVRSKRVRQSPLPVEESVVWSGRCTVSHPLYSVSLRTRLVFTAPQAVTEFGYFGTAPRITLPSSCLMDREPQAGRVIPVTPHLNTLLDQLPLPKYIH